MDKKVIMIASGDSLAGGVGTYIKKLADVIPEEVLLITGKGFLMNQYSSAFFIDGFNQVPSIKALLLLLKKIRLEKKQHKLVLIAHSTAGLWSVIFLRLFLRLPIICVYHGLASKYKGILPYLIEYVSDKVSAMSVFLNDFDKRLIRSKKGIILPSYSDPLQDVFPDIDGKIISVARHTSQKNISFLIDAAFELSCYNFQVYGSGDLLYEHQRLVFDRMQKNVEFVEWADRRCIYASKSIFVLPTFSEGFPLAVMEAASASLPLILSDIPELRAVFGSHALYFSNQNVGDLIGYIEDLKSDKKYYKERSLASRGLVEIYNESQWVSLWRKCLGQVFLN